MVNEQGQGMTDGGAAEMSGSAQGEGPAGMQTEQPRRVEPLHFPLWGSRLIEPVRHRQDLHDRSAVPAAGAGTRRARHRES